ncbi:MAG: aspartate kinase [Planctomycetota bacterium]
MKYGGTSVGDPSRIEKAAALIRRSREKGERPVVIVSAHSGVTDQLLALANDAQAGKPVDAAALRKRHVDMANGLGLDPTHVNAELDELEDLVKGVRLLGELSPRAKDRVASFGERMAAKAVAAYLSRTGTPARALMAWDAGLTTDHRFGRAQPLPQADENIARTLGTFDTPDAPVPIVTGFIGKDLRGRITTLGRNGSDYSAAIFGAAIRAKEVQIWKDVEGVMTADPRIVPTARLISNMSYDEAGELAAFGAKVIHPSTMAPAVRHEIPIRVLNMLEPDNSGTLIGKETPVSREVVKAIAHKKNISLVNVTSTKMLGAPGFLARMSRVFKEHEVEIDMIATSEVSVSLTVNDDKRLDQVVRDLERFADVTLSRGDKAIVCVVGHGLSKAKGVAGKVFSALAQADVNVDLISQGASKINIGFVVANDAVVPAVRALHASFFGA